jgi:hypothetical protein
MARAKGETAAGHAAATAGKSRRLLTTAALAAM